MNKLDYAEIIVNSPAWSGIKNPFKLVRMYTKAELKDIYNMLEEAEEDYFNYIYITEV